MTILCRQRCFSLRFRMRCRLLDCYAWLRSIPFDTFNLAAWRYHPWSFNILCVKSRSYWRFWMHSMYSTAAFVNITLHCITLSLHYVTFTTITVNVILYIWVRGHANAWSQMKPSSWMDAAGFEPTEGRAGGKRSKWFMSNNGAPKPVRHENHPAGWVIERGGVALCDACGFCVVLRFAMGFSSFCQVCVSFPLVLLFFLCACHQSLTFHPLLYFGGSFTKWQCGDGFGTWKRLFFCRAGDISLVTSVPRSCQSDTWGNLRVSGIPSTMATTGHMCTWLSWKITYKTC